VWAHFLYSPDSGYVQHNIYYQASPADYRHGDKPKNAINRGNVIIRQLGLTYQN